MCGGKFDIDPSTKCLYDLIRMRAQFRYVNDKVISSLRWFYALNSSIINGDFKTFVDEYNKIDKQRNS